MTASNLLATKSQEEIPVKKILFAVMLVAIFSVAAMAQGAKAPMLSASHGGNAVVHGGNFNPGGAPALCQGHCPFYGGDIDLNDPNANAFVNSNTLFVFDSHTYSALKAPINAMVTGMVINHLPTSTGTIYDPPVGVYDVRTGVSSGVAGTSVGGGTAALHHLATGRVAFGLTEDSAGSILTSPIAITAGTTYWFNYTPQCTNSGNSTCSAMYFFESNTDGLNGVLPQLQTKFQAFLNSSYFGYNYTNWCDVLGSGQTSACQGMSYALAGHQ
jgi:hypothetical protein